jgi:predicted amidohydrolase YtcJ
MTTQATGSTAGPTLYRGARIYSPANPHATAFAVDAGRITWLGTDDDVAGTTSIDLRGALVTPAFVDAHVHTTATGLMLTGLDLTGCASLAAALDAVAAAARPGEVLLGAGWDDSGWPERRPPTASELDAASGGGVVYLSRIDVHSAAVSSALLAHARGLTGYSESGHVSVDAHHAVRTIALQSITAGQRADAQRATLARAATLGVGSIHECGGPAISGEDDFTGLLALADAEQVPEVYGYWGELLATDKARELGAVGAGGDLFADGAIGSRTACVSERYADADTIGHPYLDGEQVGAHVAQCVRAGVQPGFHAIGDRALRIVLEEGFALAAEQVGLEAVRAVRPRIEHVEMVDAPLIKRLVEYGVIASVQPVFDALWGGADRLYAQRFGTERGAALNPFAAMKNVGVPLAFGSDAPVTPLGPWEAVRAAAYHRTPGQSIAPRAAFAAHTRGGWRALGRDDEGVLAPGAPATFAVWSCGDARPLPDVSPDAPLPICLRTVVRGRTVHAAET